MSDQTEAQPLILVVDDQEIVRFLATEILQQAGFAVATAESGAQALAAIETTAPDLVLLDVVMPDMDGFAVCETLRARAETRHLPVLMMTGLDDEGTIMHAYEIGATDFIGKPLRNVVLASRVRHLLREQRAEQRIFQLAYFDSLTGLSNRESFKERLSQAVALARRHDRVLAVLFLDLDDFKRINDTLGHNVGDLLLQEVARRLLDSVRASDCVTQGRFDNRTDLVARLGGDEFIVLLPEVANGRDAATVATRILDALVAPVILADNEIFITPSIGISLFPQDAQDDGTLLKCADTAMYFAKRGGKNLYQFYDEAMNEVAMRRLAIDTQLRTALERGEFMLHYQPQMDLVDGRICGVEALLRWYNPELGVVSPSEFIPVAEDNGLIVRIGEWVLQTACAQAKTWQNQGLALGRIGVNISALQFAQTDFVDQVTRVLDDTGLDAHALELEITETLLMKDVEGAIHTLDALKALGVQLAIDDFGTGYSSLSYLKRFPIDRLKIDQSFVRDITSDPNDAAIATAIAAMGRSMNLKVIAEGVETAAQLAFLKDKGCQEIQGYYLDHPLAPERLAEVLERDPDATAAHYGNRRTKRTVLFLDDDVEFLAVAKRALRNEGYRVIRATNAHEAFDLLAKHRVGVVIADYQMPEMNGIEFLRRIKNLSPHTVRIMVSGHGTMQAVIDAVNDGAIYKFHEKPVSKDTLRSTLREAFFAHDALGILAGED